jgi:hypothetical protein
MILNPVPSDIAQAGLRFLKTICLSSSNSKLSELQSQFLSGVQKHILNSEFEISTLETITPSELAAVVNIQEFRERMIRGGIVAACIDGTIDISEAKLIEEFTKALNIEMAPIRTAWKIANHHLKLARIDIVRKSLPGFKLKETFKNEGLIATVKQFFPLAGIELPNVTDRYRKLAAYPVGTLGKEFANYIERNQFPLPGQKGAGPEIITVHDCIHILGDYGTTAPEEIEVAAFQAGCTSQDPIYGLLFGLAQYHLNIQVAPVAPSQALQADPEKMIAAFARGCRVKRDLWADFKPWDYFNKQVVELRAEFGIEPK